jgi:hypothetical protein
VTGPLDAQPPDMAAASGAPLAEVRAEAVRLRANNPAYGSASPYQEEFDEHIRKVLRAHLAVEVRMPEVMAGLMVRERLHSAMIRDDELEWIVPAGYGWGEPGQEGNQLYGIRIRAVEGVDHLYLAVAVKS